MSEAWFEIRDLHVKIAGTDKEILKGLNLTVNQGEIHAIMGPNGSGKSTTAYAIAGHPNYEVTSGDILFKGKSILDLEADERSRAGLFLAFQYPVSIPGVTVANFLRTALNARLKVEAAAAEQRRDAEQHEGHADSGVRQEVARGDERAEGRSELRRPLPERRLLRR